MLNLDETFEINNTYVVQRDLYLRGFLYSFGVIVFIELVRAQVAEVDLLQLIPGLFNCIIYFIFSVTIFF